MRYTTATPACTEFVTPGSALVRMLVYRSFPLDVKNADVIRAVVMVHGAGRDADNYFLTVPQDRRLGGTNLAMSAVRLLSVAIGLLAVLAF